MGRKIVAAIAAIMTISFGAFTQTAIPSSIWITPKEKYAHIIIESHPETKLFHNGNERSTWNTTHPNTPIKYHEGDEYVEIELVSKIYPRCRYKVPVPQDVKEFFTYSATCHAPSFIGVGVVAGGIIKTQRPINIQTCTCSPKD